MRRPALRSALSLSILLTLAACGGKKVEEKKPAGPPPVLITTTQAQSLALEVTEDTLGTLEALVDPKIGAEVAGRVVKVAAHAGDKVRKGQMLAELDATDFTTQVRSDTAEVARLEALLAQQEKLVARQESLVAKGFISQNGAEDSRAQRDALKAQLAAARARSDAGHNNLARTRVLAPVDGVIHTQIVSPGDYVKVGDGLFQLVSNKVLRAHLPFPETAAARIRPGQPVRLVSPQAPAEVVSGKVEEVKPSVTDTARALDVMVRVDNGERLLSGGTVNGSVVTGAKPAAVVVPEQSVVLRPAGKVVYVVAGGKAQQRIIEAGVKKDGRIEIVKGLAAGEIVALDGAGFLTDGAPVSVKVPAAPAQAVAPAQTTSTGSAK